LGTWLDKQRQEKQKGCLDIERVTKLNKIGIVWDVFESQWESNYHLLYKFCKREGHCNIQKLHVEQGTKLGLWLDNQIQSKIKGRLTRNTT